PRCVARQDDTELHESAPSSAAATARRVSDLTRKPAGTRPRRHLAARVSMGSRLCLPPEQPPRPDFASCVPLRGSAARRRRVRSTAGGACTVLFSARDRWRCSPPLGILGCRTCFAPSSPPH